MVKLNVIPSFSGSYSVNSASINAKFSSKFWAAATRSLSYFYHDLVGKLTSFHFLATYLHSVKNRIIRIFFFSSPSEIAKEVVATVPIIMAGFVYRARTWTYESLKNHDVNSSHLCRVHKRKIDGSISFQKTRYPYSFFNRSETISFSIYFSLHSSYAAMAANLIGKFISNHWKPLFLHIQSPITKAPLEGVWHQHGLLSFGSYPSHTGQLYA